MSRFYSRGLTAGKNALDLTIDAVTYILKLIMNAILLSILRAIYTKAIFPKLLPFIDFLKFFSKAFSTGVRTIAKGSYIPYRKSIHFLYFLIFGSVLLVIYFGEIALLQFRFKLIPLLVIRLFRLFLKPYKIIALRRNVPPIDIIEITVTL